MCDFHPTILFSWTPPEGQNVAEEMIDLSSRLKSFSPDSSTGWEVSIIMKVQKSESSSRPGMPTQPSMSSIMVPPVYFFRFPDCQRVCAVASNKENNYTPDDVVSGEENMEKILSDYSHLIRRSFWKVRGLSYLLDQYVISVGKMEQGITSNSIVMEVSYIGEPLQHNAVIYEGIYTIAKSLLPSIPDNSDNVLSFIDHTSHSKEYSLEDRCLQWMRFLKHTA